MFFKLLAVRMIGRKIVHLAARGQNGSLILPGIAGILRVKSPSSVHFLFTEEDLKQFAEGEWIEA